MELSSRQSGRGRHLQSWVALEIALIAILIGVLYRQVLADLARDWWNEPGQSHGLLIPPLAAYVAWARRRWILRKPALADTRGLLLIGAACCLFLLGKLGAEFFLSRISLVVLLAGLAWTFWGRQRLRALAFPLLLLATMVPLPAIVYNSLAGRLQLFASEWGTALAQRLGTAVYQDGNIIHLAKTTLGVEEACSGLHSLSALVVASLLLGALCCSRFAGRAAVLACSIPIAIGINVFRIAGTAVLADYHQPLAMGFYHSVSGWLTFLLGFTILLATAQTVHWLLDPKNP